MRLSRVPRLPTRRPRVWACAFLLVGLIGCDPGATSVDDATVTIQQPDEAILDGGLVTEPGSKPQ